MDGSGFAAGCRNIEKMVNRLGSNVMGSLKSNIAGAFTVGAMTAFSKKTLDLAGHIGDMAERLGVSTDFLQEFRYVAKQAGASMEDLTRVMETFRESRDAALAGGQSGANKLAAFEAFGIGQGDLRSKRIEDLISYQISAAFEKGDPQGKLGAAWREIAGKSSGALIAGFSEGFNDMREQARKAGQVWTEDQIQQLDTFGDYMATFGDSLMIHWGTAMIKVVEWARWAANKIDQNLNYYTAGTSKWSAKDWILNALNPLGATRADLGAKPFDTQSAVQAMNLSEKEFAEAMAAEAEARKKAREMRARNRMGGDVDPVMLEAGRIKKNPALKEGDSLVRVGNFLGTSQSSLVVIGERTNALLYSIDQRLARLTTAKQSETVFPI